MQSLTERVFPCFSHGCQWALPCSSLGWHLPKLEHAQERRAGEDLFPSLGGKQPTGEGSKESHQGAEMWGAGGSWRATMSRGHTRDARRDTQGLPCSAPAVCSWQQLHPPAQQRAASLSPPAGVSGQQPGHPSVWPASRGGGTSVGITTFRPIPSTPDV